MSILPFIAQLFARLKVMITVDVAEKFHLYVRIGRRSAPPPTEFEILEPPQDRDADCR